MAALFGDRWLDPEDIQNLLGVVMNAGCFCLVCLPFTLLLSLLYIRRRNRRITAANPDRRDPV